MNEKILIVEDEEKLAKILELYFKREGFETVLAFDGKAGLDKALTEDFDFIVLDRMLPFVSGDLFIHEYRKFKETPILMLTAKGTDDDKIEGFNLGTDDYVVKPANPNEIVLRIKAILKRVKGGGKDSDGIVTFGEIVIDRDRFTVTDGGEKIPLTRAEFNILLRMASEPGLVFSRDRLMESISEDGYVVSDRTVDSHIKNLRKKLKHDYVKTVFGIGYKIDE